MNKTKQNETKRKKNAAAAITFTRFSKVFSVCVCGVCDCASHFSFIFSSYSVVQSSSVRMSITMFFVLFPSPFIRLFCCFLLLLSLTLLVFIEQIKLNRVIARYWF